jgi:hypothetical protein
MECTGAAQWGKYFTFIVKRLPDATPMMLLSTASASPLHLPSLEVTSPARIISRLPALCMHPSTVARLCLVLMPFLTCVDDPQ